jgi:hypothetical protein
MGKGQPKEQGIRVHPSDAAMQLQEALLAEQRLTNVLLQRLLERTEKISTGTS